MTAPDQKICILVVDDRPENLTALEAILEHPQYTVVKAESGEEALKHVLKEDFAAILLDVQMPGLDGFETAALIHRRRRSRHVPILFITAINKEDTYVFRGYSLGAVDYIFKPVDPDILRAKVAVFAELYRKNRQIQWQAEQLRRSEQREQQRQYADLQERSEHRYRNLGDAIPQILWATDLDGAINYCNRRWTEYTGIAAGEFMGKTLRTFIHPRDFVSVARRIRGASERGEGVTVEARLGNGRDGIYRWHLVQLLPERDPEGRLSGWLGTATDIHDQKRIEQELADGKERLDITLRCIGDGVITTDVGGRVVLLNNAAESLTGWSRAEAMGRPLEEVFAIESQNHHSITDLVGSLLRGERAPETDHCVYLRSRAGVERLISKKIAPLFAGENQTVGAVIVFQDVTEKQRIEEERQKASRLESIGVLAGSIAHDFNNILTAIMGNISLAKLYSSKGDNVYERLSEAEKAALWARDLTQQLLTFSKGGSPMRKVIDAAVVVREAAEFACRGSLSSCEVEAVGPAAVEADESQVRQVIHNLVLNAQQAMGEGGRIRVGLKPVTLERQQEIPLPPGRYVEITCQDEGIGIAPEHLSKIFDPYFTTKQKGTGLGLATSYSIIKRHDGFIKVESSPGQGTCFSVYLPASDKKVAGAETGAQEGAQESGRVLVMDDEAFIRELLKRLFGHFGYYTEFAEDGQEALDRYARALERGEPFDVVIMDLVIPGGMGGQEAVKKLLALDPGARVVVSSGYSNDPVMANFRRYGFCDAVAKPYKNDELRQVVSRLIGQRREPACLSRAL